MTLLALTVVVLAQADGGARDVDVMSGASVNATIDAEAATDLLVASSVNDDVGAGTPAALDALELGLRGKLHATGFSRRAHFDFDYQGRQPIAGTSQNTAIHLLYQAELSVDLWERRLSLGLGRFVAPSAGFLPVDGLRAQVRLSKVELQLFGGRRAITSTRTGNVDLSTFLPAAGASAALSLERLRAEVVVSFNRDEVPLAQGPTSSFDAFSVTGRAVGRPFDGVTAGVDVSVAQRASYVIGPVWNSVALSARTVDLSSAVAFVEARPHKTLRIAYDFHFQQAWLFREGVRLDETAAVTADGFVPLFVDNRVRVRWRPFGLGWLGPDLRFRIRPDRHEWRVGAQADLAPDWAQGFCLRGGFTFEKMVRTGVELAPSDRSYWSASVGWRGKGFDVAAGASNVQRSVMPLSSRVYTPYDDTPTKPVDLSPFNLEAQRLGFVRAFYASGIWFGGLDFEQSLTDGRERRFFVQVGARLEKEW